jgi:hypothetical protein
MAQFKIRRLAYARSASGDNKFCVAAFLFDGSDVPLGIFFGELDALRELCPRSEFQYLAEVVADLRGLGSSAEAIRDYITTRLAESSLSLTLEAAAPIEALSARSAEEQAAACLIQGTR